METLYWQLSIILPEKQFFLTISFKSLGELENFITDKDYKNIFHKILK